MYGYSMQYLKLWLRTAFRHSLEILDLWSSILGAAAVAICHFLPNGEQLMSALTWQIPICVATMVVLVRLIAAPYWIWKEDQKKINKLERLDDSDLEHLLNGVFWEDTFLYKAEITLCRDFKGKFDIEQIQNTFTDIPVHAPKNSWADIHLQFMNGRDNINAKCYFYILDEQNKPKLIENVYGRQHVFLNEKSCFSLKFVCDENYKLHDSASLRITVDSWTK